MKKLLYYLKHFFAFYTVVCTLLYLFQESLFFHPRKIDAEFVYRFTHPFKELNFDTEDGEKLNAIHFKVDNPKGAVLFLHGNGGTVDSWGKRNAVLTDNGYDVLYLDYRGYGKSTGAILSEQMLVDDAQIAYDYLKQHYNEENIIISGTSMGTGMASILAGQNNPSKLLLNSPFSSLKALAMEKVFFVPPFLIKYEFESILNLEKVKCPIYIFHGSEDDLIPLKHAEDIVDKFPETELTILEGRGHNATFDKPPPLFISRMSEILK